MVIVPLVSGCYQPPASPAPPTAAPAPTPVRATAVAALQSGPTATQVAVAQATSIAASPIHIAGVSADPENVGNSAVTLTNTGTAPVNLGGWVLLVANYRVTLPTTEYMTIGPGSGLIVHLTTSPGPTNGQNVYVGLGAASGTPRLDADTTVLLDPRGQVAATYPPAN
jgi:hypothetical protein